MNTVRDKIGETYEAADEAADVALAAIEPIKPTVYGYLATTSIITASNALPVGLAFLVGPTPALIQMFLGINLGGRLAAMKYMNVEERLTQYYDEQSHLNGEEQPEHGLLKARATIAGVGFGTYGVGVYMT